MTLAALNCQVTEAMDFLHNPIKWAKRLRQLPPDKHPEMPALIASVEYLAGFKGADIMKKKEMLLTKIGVFGWHPDMQAQFGSNTPGVNWREVIAKKQIVLIDLHSIDKGERLSFLVWWYFSYLTSFIKFRGAGRHKGAQIALYIDELAVFMTGSSNKAQDLFVEQFQQLINVYSRNNGLILNVALQEIWQMPENAILTLFTLGNWFIGNVTDPDSAETIAKLFCKYMPDWERKSQAVWMGNPWGVWQQDEATTEYSLEEQWELQKQQFMNQAKFHMCMKLCREEGDMRGELRGISIANLLPDRWLTDEEQSEIRIKLAKINGVPLRKLNEEVRLRQLRLEQMDAVNSLPSVAPYTPSAPEDAATPGVLPAPVETTTAKLPKQSNGHKGQPSQGVKQQAGKPANGNGHNGQKPNGGHHKNQNGNGHNQQKANGQHGKVGNVPLTPPPTDIFLGKN